MAGKKCAADDTGRTDGGFQQGVLGESDGGGYSLSRQKEKVAIQAGGTLGAGLARRILQAAFYRGFDA